MEVMDFSALPDFPRDSDEDIEGGQLVEVSKYTRNLLYSKCTRSVPNEKRRRIKGQYPQPKVAATRTPKLDDSFKQILPAAARTMDKDLARIQTFVLDAVSPLVSLLEAETTGKSITLEDAKAATTAALELVCNASARISRLRREKACIHLKKEVQPLAQRDELFGDAAPYLFGPEFAQKSKEQVEQMRAIQAVVPPKKPFFRAGPPENRGGYSQGSYYQGRSGASKPNHYRGNFRGRKRPFNAQFSQAPPRSGKD